MPVVATALRHHYEHRERAEGHRWARYCNVPYPIAVEIWNAAIEAAAAEITTEGDKYYDDYAGAFRTGARIVRDLKEPE